MFKGGLKFASKRHKKNKAGQARAFTATEGCLMYLSTIYNSQVKKVSSHFKLLDYYSLEYYIVKISSIFEINI